jgi:hypothetical protein
VARLRNLWDALRGSFWFLPALITALAAALALGLLALDRRLDNQQLAGLLWLYAGGAEGARSLLSAVAGSVTVVGLAFSITSDCLLVLRTVRGRDGLADGTFAFTPIRLQGIGSRSFAERLLETFARVAAWHDRRGLHLALLGEVLRVSGPDARRDLDVGGLAA